MTTGLSYAGTVPGTDSYIQQIATLSAVADLTDPNFVIILPQMIVYAENRICRDLDFLFSSTSVTGYQCSIGSRQITIPEGTLVVSEQINIITPAGTSNPELGTRNACIPVTKEWLDMVYGASTFTGLPTYFCPFNDNLFLIGPFPDQNYYVEIVGTYRPASLSATNTTTFISLYLPDLFLMASMIYMSGFQRNFSSTGNDPAMPVNYEQQYSALLKGAMTEELRKKWESVGWTSQSPSPVATPSRGV